MPWYFWLLVGFGVLGVTMIFKGGIELKGENLSNREYKVTMFVVLLMVLMIGFVIGTIASAFFYL